MRGGCSTIRDKAIAKNKTGRRIQISGRISTCMKVTGSMVEGITSNNQPIFLGIPLILLCLP